MFDRLNKPDCVVPAGGVPVVNPLCSDAAFAAANPELCASQSYLIIKPEVQLLCRLGSTTFRVFEYKNSVETEVTDNLTFESSDDTVFAVGVHTGSGTGLTAGVAEIVVTRNGLTAKAEITVLEESTCCNSIAVKSSVLIDNSRSSSLGFGNGYSSRLDFAKAVAEVYASKIIPVSGVPKDKIKIFSFTETPDEISSDFISDETELASEITGIASTNNKTDLVSILTAATNDLFDSIADEKVIILISDGEQTANTNTQGILDAAATFKSAGGIIIVIGLRASGDGYDLLSRVATGGFFINALPSNSDLVVDQLNFLKSILCVAQCDTVEGVISKPALDYSSFQNWEVVSGNVSLYGAGLLDLQPGHGLYVALKDVFPGTIQSIDTFDLVEGQSYRVSFKAAGNNRINTPTAEQAVKFFLRDVDAALTDPNIFEHTVVPNWDAAFFDYNFTFVASHNVTVRLSFKQIVNPLFSGAWYGNLIDDIRFDEVSTLTNLLTDNFDTENEVYVPPGCGAGTIGHLVPEVNPYFDYFQSLQKQRYYDFAVDDMRFFVLSSDPREPDGVTPESIQGQWLQARLTDSVEAFKIVILHHAPFSSGITHGSNAWMQWPFYDWGVAAVIAGHDHDYERLSIGDIKYFVVGTGGHSIRGFGSILGQSIAHTSDFGFLKIQLYDTGGLKFQFIETDDSIFDDNSIGNTAGEVVKTVAVIGDYGGDTADEADVAASVIRANPDAVVTVGDNYYQSDPQPSIDEQIGKYYSQFIHHYNGSFGVGSTVDKFFPALGNHDWDFLDATIIPAHYSYATGYNCYGGGCAELTLQSQDRSPLPNIETDVVTSQMFTGNKTVCASCPTDYVNLSYTSFSFDGGESVEFANLGPMKPFGFAVNLIGYSNIHPSVTATLFGSNDDGATWTNIGTGTQFLTTGQTGFVTDIRIGLFVSNATRAYAKFKVEVSANAEAGLSIGSVSIAVAGASTVCKDATATSFVSQADADAKATSAAQILASSSLNCLKRYTSTQQFTAKCPVGALGTSVTKSITSNSFVSQDDADLQALSLAQALAEAALVCTGSNNNGLITINDHAAASPYPGVQYVSGKSGHITKATVKINGLTHKSAQDVSILLRSPSGTLVELIRNCGAVCQLTNVDLVFDDDAAGSLPDTDTVTCLPAIVSGTYKPTQKGSFYPYPAPCPSGTPNNTLASLIGESPNGSWSLWVQDVADLDAGKIDSWSIELTTA